MTSRCTVVIPLFDKEAVVGRAIRSVMDQTVRDWTLIVVNDGSTDGSTHVAREFADPRIRVIDQENAGPGAARNSGLLLAHTPFVAFLDADDEWRPDFLARMLFALEEHGDVAVAYSSWLYGNDQRSVVGEQQSRGVSAGRWQLTPGTSPRLIKHRIDSLHTSACVARTAEITKRQGFYDRERCTYGEDAFLWARVLFAGCAVFRIPEPLIRFHTDASALSVGRASPYPLPPLLSKPMEVLTGASDGLETTVRAYLGWYALFVFRRALLQRSGRTAIGAARSFMKSQRRGRLGQR